MVDYPIMARDLASIVGAPQVTSTLEELAAWAVDGQVPGLAVFPRGLEEVERVVTCAERQGAAIVPRGAGTRMAMGSPPRRVDLIVGTKRLDRIVDLDADNLTITAQAGVTLEQAQAVLAAHGQTLPLDPPFPFSTLGGVIATNASGPKRLAYGAPRDLVLGLKAVLADGRLVSPGGKVVKNVAGYDMGKLFIGSIGTLGFLVEVTLRTVPTPEAERMLVASFGSLSQALEVSGHLLRSALRPAAAAVLSDQASNRLPDGVTESLPKTGYLLFLSAAGSTEATARQMEGFRRQCGDAGAAEMTEPAGGRLTAVWTAIGALQMGIPIYESATVCRVGVPISALGRTLEAVERLVSAAGLRLSMLAYTGVGVAYCSLTSAEPVLACLDRFVRALTDLSTISQQAGGRMVIQSAPLEVKQRVDVWGRPGSDFRLMQGLKRKLDPKGIFNPGRFIGAI